MPLVLQGRGDEVHDVGVRHGRDADREDRGLGGRARGRRFGSLVLAAGERKGETGGDGDGREETGEFHLGALDFVGDSS